MRLAPEDISALTAALDKRMTEIIEFRIDYAVRQIPDEVARCLAETAADEIRAKVRDAVRTVSVTLKVKQE